MSRPNVSMTGLQLIGYILREKPSDDPDANDGKYFFSGFYHRGSAMRQAGRQQRLAAKNPNEQPIPFVMPSESWTDNYFKQHTVGQPPTYTITSHIFFGGGMNYDSSTATFVEIKNEIVIRDTTFEDSVVLTYILDNYAIKFENCIFKNILSISNSKVEKLTIWNCKGLDYLTISNVNIPEVIIENSNFKDISISVDHTPTSYQFNIIQNDIEKEIKKIKILGCETENFSMKGKSITNIEYKRNKFTNPNIDLFNEYINFDGDKSYWIRSIQFKIDNKNSSELSTIKNLWVEVLTISGTIKKDRALSLENLSIKNLMLEEFNNYGRFVLLGVSVDVLGSTTIRNSDLGKTSFVNSSFQNVKNFTIEMSNIMDIITHDTSFPLDINKATIEQDITKGISNQREIYRHLKNAASKQSDRYNELRYEAVEMELLRTILSKENKADAFLFWWNYHTNRHGQNWLLALLWLGITGLIVFTVIQFTLGYTKINFEALPENIGNYFAFLNPVHRIWEVFDKENQFRDGFALLLDFGYRIFSGYFIFQLVRASRKYFK